MERSEEYLTYRFIDPSSDQDDGESEHGAVVGLADRYPFGHSQSLLFACITTSDPLLQMCQVEFCKFALSADCISNLGRLGFPQGCE